MRERPLAVAAFATITLVVAFALAWFAPLVAIVVAWPFLFAIPGWLLVARLVPRLGPAGRLGVGIVLSTYVAAHLANLVGLAAGGFDRPVAFATAAILGGASLLLAVAPIRGLAAPPSLDPRGALEAARRERAPFVLATFGFLLVGGILAANAWREIPAGWVSGGWNWSDLPRPRLDRPEHRRGQLPAPGPVLRGRPADLPLVRRLPRRHLGRGRGPPRDPRLHRVERAHGRGPRARRVGACPAA